MNSLKPRVTEWTRVTDANFCEWADQLFQPPVYNSLGSYYEEPVVRTVLMRVPGKWQRRVRCWAASRQPGCMVSSAGHPAMQVEQGDGCPLDRGPIVYLSSMAYWSSDFDKSELAGLEWMDLPEEPK